jgi:solute carrier family 25, member 39/40
MTELRGSAADPSRSPHAISDAAARRGTKQRAAPTTTNTTDGNAPTSNPLASPSPCSYASSCKSSPLYARIVSGSVGSVLTSLLVTPLEVVKVRQQALSFEQQQQQMTMTAALQSPQHPSGVSASISRGGSKGMGMASAAAPSPGVTLCRRGCGTFVLNNGLSDCLLPKSAVPYFDRTTGLLTEAARGTLAAAAANGSVGAAQTISKPPKPAGTFAMLRRIFRREGLEGIYAGLRPTLVMAVPNTVLYFSAYDELVYRFRNDGRDYVDPKSPLIPLVAGGGARFLASGVTAPFELLRTRQASLVGSAAIQPPPAASANGGLIREFRTIVEREGVGALYRGLRPTLWRDVPFSAIYWLCLEEMRLVWKERARSTAPISPSEQATQAFVNGAVSGMIAACFTTPFDVLKTRQQQLAQQQQAVTEEAAVVASNAARAAAVSCSHDGAVVFYGGPNPPLTPAPSPSPSTFGSLRQIASTEGVSALWRGNHARMLKVAPACAIMISSYELGKRILLDSD